MDEAFHSGVGTLSIVNAICSQSHLGLVWESGGGAYSWVLMLSNGVTASSDSVMPVAMPANTVAGPEILPFSSLNMFV